MTNQQPSPLQLWFRQNWRRILVSLGLTFLFLLDSTGHLSLPLMARLENVAYDARIRMTTESDHDDRIVIIDIDEKSLAQEGHWPWSRQKLSRLVDLLFDEYGIALLSMDVVFAERDENEGLRLLDSAIDRQQNESLQQLMRMLRAELDPDHAFARSLADRPVVLGYYFTHSDEDRFAKGGLPAPVAEQGKFDPEHGAYIEASGYGANIEVLQASAAGAGFFENPSADEDGIFRRAPMLQQYQGALYASLSLATAQAYLGRKPELVIERSGSGDYQSIEKIQLGSQMIPVASDTTALIPFKGPQGSFRYISAADILNRTLADPYALIGQVAFLGTTAPGLVDARPTPIQKVFPGVEIHANLFAGILDNSFRHRPPYAHAAEALILLLTGIVLTLVLTLANPWLSTSATALALGSVVYGNLYLWQEQRLVLELAQPILLIASLFLFNVSYGFISTTRSKQQLGKRFGQYVPPELVEEMAQNPGEFTLKGERREMTVLFSDIRNFTSWSEKLDPVELSNMLNEYLTPMTAVIHERRGTIDKYIGDAIMAFWGAPLDDETHALHALEAALEMQRTANHLREEFSRRGLAEIHIGIGVNTGPMNVGNMGSEFRMAYTVLGDSVNLAARLEGLTKHYEAPIIVGKSTREVADNHFMFRELDYVRVKGKREPVAIYELLGKIGDMTEDQLAQLELYHRALKNYRHRAWDRARQQFELLLAQAPASRLFRLYLDRIEKYTGQPPGPDWDGVHDHEIK